MTDANLPKPEPPSPPGIPGVPAFAIPPELFNFLLALLGVFLQGLITKPGAGAPPIAPPAPPAVPPPSPAPAPPVVSGPKRRIVSGRGEFQSATVGGPLGPRIADAVFLRIIHDGEPAPNDTRFYIDITCRDQFGKDFVGGDDSWNTDPQPASPGATEPVRIHFTFEGDGDASLSHEYANFGNDPRIRCEVPPGGHGRLRNVYALGPDYGDGTPPARITFNVADPINVGQ